MLQNTLVLLLYSPAYRKMADALSAERLAFMPSAKSYISRLRWV
jgi:hypothetical protein